MRLGVPSVSELYFEVFLFEERDAFEIEAGRRGGDLFFRKRKRIIVGIGIDEQIVQDELRRASVADFSSVMMVITRSRYGSGILVVGAGVGHFLLSFRSLL